MTPFPIIVGEGRSGTTLLRAMFDSHPTMAIPEESEFLVPLGRARHSFEREGGFSTDAFLADLCGHYGFRRWGMPSEVIERAFQARPPRCFPDAVHELYSTWAARQGKTRYGDKTPHYVNHIGFLAAILPEARFIHIIRDGRDVTLSYLERKFGPKNVAEGAYFWRRRVRGGRQSGRRLGPDRYRETRYEDLVDDPEAVLRELCGFIDLDFDGSMLRYFERAGSVAGSDPDHRHLYLPPTKGLRDWRRDMSRADILVFEALAGDLLGALGYELAAERIGPAVQVRADIHRLAIQGRRMRHHLRTSVRTGRRRARSDVTAARPPGDQGSAGEA